VRIKERLAKFDHQKPAPFLIGRRYAAHARAAAANTAAWGLIPGLSSSQFPALALPSAAHWGVVRGVGGGGETRGGQSLLGDVWECAGRRGFSCRQWADSISRRWA